MSEIFEQYVSNFDLEDNMIIGKRMHSYRVCEKAKWLADQLKLDEENVFLATAIGLLHDIARFEQATKYHSFNDSETFDHGDYGCKILFEEGLIREFPIDEKYYLIIEKAIRNHNKAKIEDGLNEQELLQARIIRDSDKLDIFYIISCLNESYYPITDNKISDSVDEHFKKHELVLRRDIKHSNDEVIKAICFIYDFYFKESYIYMKENKYLEQFEQKVNNSEIFGYYFSEAKKYLDERI